jgi:hypothetical protein
MSMDTISVDLSGKYLNLDFIWCPVCMTRTEHEVVSSKLRCKPCRIRERTRDILDELGYDPKDDER